MCNLTHSCVCPHSFLRMTSFISCLTQSCCGKIILAERSWLGMLGKNRAGWGVRTNYTGLIRFISVCDMNHLCMWHDSLVCVTWLRVLWKNGAGWGVQTSCSARGFQGVEYLRYAATYCNTLQHTATHCNTLQHTATHCTTLQHTATRCNILQNTAPHCTMLQRTAPHCSTLQHTARGF